MGLFVVFFSQKSSDSKSFGSKKPRKGDYDISGEILVTVEYKGGEIIAYIDRALGIAAANKDGTSDSYVKTYLLPDRTKQSKRKTEVQKKTIDPLYNTTLKVLTYKLILTTSITLISCLYSTKYLSTNLGLGQFG